MNMMTKRSLRTPLSPRQNFLSSAVVVIDAERVTINLLL